MKTDKELKVIKDEYKKLSDKLKELTDNELKEVCVGVNIWDIAFKLKDEFYIGSEIYTRGKNGEPTLTFSNEAFGGLIENNEKFIR